MSSTSGFDASFIEGGYESYDDSEMHYSDTFSDDYFIEDYCFDPLDWPGHLARVTVKDSLANRLYHLF